MGTNEDTNSSILQRRADHALNFVASAGFWYQMGRYNPHLSDQCLYWIGAAEQSLDLIIRELELDRMGIFKQQPDYNEVWQTIKSYADHVMILQSRLSKADVQPIPEWAKKALDRLDGPMMAQLRKLGFVAGILPSTGQYTVLAEPPSVDHAMLAEYNKAALQAHRPRNSSDEWGDGLPPYPPGSLPNTDATEALLPPDAPEPATMTHLEVAGKYCELPPDVPAICAACGNVIIHVTTKKLGKGIRYMLGCPACNQGPQIWCKMVDNSRLIYAPLPHSKSAVTELDTIS